MYNDWKQVLLSKLRERDDETQEEAEEKDPAFNADIEKLKAEYAILIGDKAINTHVICCKTWLCHWIMRETRMTDTYLVRDADGDFLDANCIVERDYEFVHTMGLAVRVSPDTDAKVLPQNTSCSTNTSQPLVSQ